VAHYPREADPYKCSCGDTFGGFTLLETHLDLLRDDAGSHVEVAASRAGLTIAGEEPTHRLAPGIRPGTASLRVCSCGSVLSDVTALDDHLDVFGDDSIHTEMALDLNTLVRLGIRRIRTERGLSMHAMADLLGVHASAVCRIEGGQRHAVGWGRTHRTVAVLLGVDVRELLRTCEHCGYRPPTDYRCMRCGMPGAV
jgi:hypothetical protein